MTAIKTRKDSSTETTYIVCTEDGTQVGVPPNSMYDQKTEYREFDSRDGAEYHLEQIQGAYRVPLYVFKQVTTRKLTKV